MDENNQEHFLIISVKIQEASLLFCTEYFAFGLYFFNSSSHGPLNLI